MTACVQTFCVLSAHENCLIIIGSWWDIHGFSPLSCILPNVIQLFNTDFALKKELQGGHRRILFAWFEIPSIYLDLKLYIISNVLQTC